MPKIVDHEARRAEISAALWRIIERDGISGASIRSVANEAGYPKATAMHYFKNESALLIYAMDQFIANSQSKISDLTSGTPTFETFVTAILHAIPTSSRERRISSIWLALVAKSPDDPEIRSYLTAANRRLEKDLQSLLRLMQQHKLVSQDRDLDTEARSLHALVDGLTLQTMTSSTNTGPNVIKSIVRSQVQALAK